MFVISKEIEERIRKRAIEMAKQVFEPSESSDVRVAPLGGKPFGELQISLVPRQEEPEQEEIDNAILVDFPDEEALKDFKVLVLGPE